MYKITAISILLLLYGGFSYCFGEEISDSAYPLIPLNVFTPESILQCFKNSKVANLEILREKNPFYLRGDFNGDKNPDYAVQVKAKSGGSGICICAGDGSIHMLGSGIVGGKNFSDMENDRFLALHWAVSTKQEIDELTKWKCNIPDPFPKIENESIELFWREGESALIYWDGKQYKWTGGFTLEPREDCIKAMQNGNVAAGYGREYSNDAPLIFKGGSTATGGSAINPATGDPIHSSHRNGANIDLLYMDANGRELTGNTAAANGDPIRNGLIINLFSQQNAGLGAALTGDPARYGLGALSTEALRLRHLNHMHFQNTYPARIEPSIIPGQK